MAGFVEAGSREVFSLAVVHPDTGLLTTVVGVWVAHFDESALESEFSNPYENDLKTHWEQLSLSEQHLSDQEYPCAMSLAALALARSKNHLSDPLA